MANAIIRLAYKNSAWFTANASLVLAAGRVVFLSGTRTFKVGDGSTQLQSLSFYDAAGGVTDHTALSNLAWTSSGHTGTASRIAGFSGAGAAAYYDFGSTAGTICDGGDSRLSDIRTAKSIAVTSTPVSCSTTGADEKLYSVFVPASLVNTASVLVPRGLFSATTSGNTKTLNFWIHTSDTLSGATKIATVSGSTSLQSWPFRRRYWVVDNTTIISQANATTAYFSDVSTVPTAPSNTTVPSLSAGFWFLVSGNRANSGDTLTMTAFQLSVEKS